MGKGSVGQSSIMVYGRKPRRPRPKKIKIANNVYCYRCQGVISAGLEAMSVGRRHYEHLECYIPHWERKKPEHKSGPVTITRMEPKPPSHLKSTFENSAEMKPKKE